MAEVAGLLEQGRLVMVTGPGGSGKTRLAAEVASRVADGVWLVELPLVADPAQVSAVVAAELCAGLLLACDDVPVLATSRPPLRMAGEARYRCWT